jgi:modification methylase
LEREESYAALARARIAEIKPLEAADLLSVTSKRTEPRVPFGSLVERGLVQPGEVMFDQTRRWTAKVRPDGTLIWDKGKGSIHQVAAAVQGAPTCNGWSFWWVERNGKPVAIELLRQQVRADYAP